MTEKLIRMELMEEERQWTYKDMPKDHYVLSSSSFTGNKNHVVSGKNQKCIGSYGGNWSPSILFSRDCPSSICGTLIQSASKVVKSVNCKRCLRMLNNGYFDQKLKEAKDE